MKRISRGKVLSGAGGGAIIAQGSFAHAAGTVAAGAETSYTSAVTGVQRGDLCVATSNAIPGSASVNASVATNGTLHVSVHGAVGGTSTWSAGTIFYRVERLS